MSPQDVSATQCIPRRWTVEVDGIRWLPRMIDKARMSASGGLGAYLIGNSPVDRALLRHLKLTTPEFVEIATAYREDAAVLDALRQRGFDEPRVRSWSDRFPQTYRWLIPLWDLDEGYIKPNAVTRVALAVFRKTEGPLMAAFRKISPAP
ncbi:MAG TPA: DUF5069 domain-containing protein [Candidatus Acidoferrales bacterium]|nr:DUF5069 domain-containing protein [Candidatus Acidoferrales bacterium]